MRFTLIQYSNQFALGGWSWTVLTYRVQRKVLTSDLGRSYLLPTRANGTLHERSEVVKDFTPECGGINRGDTPRVPKAPRGVPEVDPDTRGE